MIVRYLVGPLGSSKNAAVKTVLMCHSTFLKYRNSIFGEHGEAEKG